MSWLAAAAASAIETAIGASATTIRIKRADGEGGYWQTALLTAGVGNSRFETLDTQEQLLSRHESQDFLLAANKIIFEQDHDPAPPSALPVKPQEGDRIEVTRSDTDADGTTITHTTTYAVYAPQPEQPWRYCNRFRTHFRIHTKAVADAYAATAAE